MKKTDSNIPPGGATGRYLRSPEEKYTDARSSTLDNRVETEVDFGKSEKTPDNSSLNVHKYILKDGHSLTLPLKLGFDKAATNASNSGEGTLLDKSLHTPDCPPIS